MTGKFINVKKWILVAILLVFYMSAKSQTNYNLYTYFVYTIAKYVEWPDDYKTGDFVIGVLGDSKVEEALKVMAMKAKVAGRPIKIAHYTSLSDISKCNMLFLPIEQSDQLPGVLKKLRGKATLVMTEEEGMALKGSCVNFVQRNGKPAFELNKVAMDKANLKASSELTRFAIVL